MTTRLLAELPDGVPDARSPDSWALRLGDLELF
jgi:hypothetical protein